MSVFDSLIDQEHVISVLKDAVAASRSDTNESQEMTHAWLFTGPPGSGRSNAAIAFAAALVCPQGGCGTCTDCITATKGTHADVELIRTEGLSIKIDEVRDLITRASWNPSVANYRVVIMEDSDRLTESAANALLKAIEEPGLRTVWLMCAPSTTDVLPTIRSRTRSLILKTPSVTSVATLLEKENITPTMAAFASRASQGHIGRARHLATNESARAHRESILKLALNIQDIAGAFKAAQDLVESAKTEAEKDSTERNEREIAALKDAWGTQTTKISSTNTKALKELEKDQKSRTTRMVRDYLDRALLDMSTVYRDIMFLQSGAHEDLINQDLAPLLSPIANRTPPESTLTKIEAITSARTNLSHNAAPLLTVEAMMLQLKEIYLDTSNSKTVKNQKPNTLHH